MKQVSEGLKRERAEIINKNGDAWDLSTDEILVFEDGKPAHFDFPEETGIFIIFKENGEFSGDSHGYYDTILIQNGELYRFKAKIKEIVLENGKRYSFS